jgi:rod shape determining protein RodA
VTSVLGELASPHRASAAPGRHVDWILVGSTFGIAAMGVLLIFSATRGSASDPSMTFVARQGFFVLVGAGVLAVVSSRDYRAMRTYVEPAFLVTLALLLLVLTPVGSESKGAQAWFEFAGFQAQPSELAKLVLIVALAHRIAEAGGALDTRQLASVLAIAGLPMVLILLQPDLGTMLVFVAITIGMVLVGGARSRDLLVLVLLGVIAMGAILHSDVLAEYQKERLTTFLDPGNDLRGTTYNVDQAQIAVGSGGLTGRGLFNGAQTQGGRVPEQQTDFIFTVIGEELGFVGSATLLALYSVLLWRIWRAAQRARDPYGTLLCVGVLSMLVFQIFQNVGMAMGIMPVTGIPLPLLSYGGSSTITSFLAIGLVLNVHMRRFV